MAKTDLVETDSPATEIGSRLEAIVDGQGRKKVWLARQLGIPKTRLYSIFAGKTEMTVGEADAAARLLGVSITQFLPGWSGPPAPPIDEALRRVAPTEDGANAEG